MEVKVNFVNEPQWGEFTVNTKLPEKLEHLTELAKNLYWVWNVEVKQLFRKIDSKKWTACRHNPMAMLDIVPAERFEELAKDESFIAELNKVYANLKAYLAEKPNEKSPSVAYFSMAALHSRTCDTLPGDDSTVSVNIVCMESIIIKSGCTL